MNNKTIKLADEDIIKNYKLNIFNSIKVNREKRLGLLADLNRLDETTDKLISVYENPDSTIQELKIHAENSRY